MNRTDVSNRPAMPRPVGSSSDSLLPRLAITSHLLAEQQQQYSAFLLSSIAVYSMFSLACEDWLSKSPSETPSIIFLHVSLLRAFTLAMPSFPLPNSTCTLFHRLCHYIRHVLPFNLLSLSHLSSTSSTSSSSFYLSFSVLVNFFFSFFLRSLPVSCPPLSCFRPLQSFLHCCSCRLPTTTLLLGYPSQKWLLAPSHHSAALHWD